MPASPVIRAAAVCLIVVTAVCVPGSTPAQIVPRERVPPADPRPAVPLPPTTQPTFTRPGMTLLLSEAARFTEDKLALVLLRVTGEKFARTAKGNHYFVPSRFVDTWDIVHGDLRFELFTGDLLPLSDRRWPGPGPQTPDKRWAYVNSTGEIRLQWINPTPNDEQRTQRANAFIGSVLAELMNDDCLAIMRLSEKSLDFELCSPLTARELRSADPFLATTALVKMPERTLIDRERAAEATALARANWPEFVEAVQTRARDDVLAIRATVEGEDHGGLGQLLLVDLAAGQRIIAQHPGEPGRGRVELTPDQVLDWMVCRKGRIEGRFLLNCAREIRLEMRERGGGGG